MSRLQKILLFSGPSPISRNLLHLPGQVDALQFDVDGALAGWPWAPSSGSGDRGAHIKSADSLERHPRKEPALDGFQSFNNRRVLDLGICAKVYAGNGWVLVQQVKKRVRLRLCGGVEEAEIVERDGGKAWVDSDQIEECVSPRIVAGWVVLLTI